MLFFIPLHITHTHTLTHWGRVMHIYVGNVIIIVSHNGFLPGRRQTIIWTNAGILLIRPLGINFSEILIQITGRYVHNFKYICKIRDSNTFIHQN